MRPRRCRFHRSRLRSDRLRRPCRLNQPLRCLLVTGNPRPLPCWCPYPGHCSNGSRTEWRRSDSAPRLFWRWCSLHHVERRKRIPWFGTGADVDERVTSAVRPWGEFRRRAHSRASVRAGTSCLRRPVRAAESANRSERDLHPSSLGCIETREQPADRCADGAARRARQSRAHENQRSKRVCLQAVDRSRQHSPRPTRSRDWRRSLESQRERCREARSGDHPLAHGVRHAR